MYVCPQSPARALRALGLLLADGVPTVGLGKTFWCVGRFFYENGRNSETKSRKIVLKVRNGPFFPRATIGPLKKFGSNRKHRKNCESCPTQVTWKVKFKSQICLSCLSSLTYLSCLSRVLIILSVLCVPCVLVILSVILFVPCVLVVLSVLMTMSNL